MKKLLFLIVAIAVLGLIVPGCIPVVPPSEQGDLSTLTKAISTWYVDGALGTDDGTHGIGTGSSAFKTIQYAINDPRVENGDTINVAAGTYNENVVINKSLTLRGVSNPVIVGGAGHGIHVQASNVVVQGMTVRGSKVGILVRLDPVIISNVTITSNNVHNNAFHGIVLHNVADCTIDNNTASNNGWTGITVLAKFQKCTI